MKNFAQKVINIVIAIIIISSCDLKEESFSEVNCISIEPIGVRDALKHRIAVGLEPLSCGFKNETFENSLDVRNFIVSDSTFYKLKDYVIKRQVESDELVGDAYSGYSIMAFDNKSEVLSYNIIGAEKYHNYFNGLIKAIGSNSETDTLNLHLEDNGYYWKKDPFYWKKDSVISE